jgi:hypothetical protein
MKMVNEKIAFNKNDLRLIYENTRKDNEIMLKEIDAQEKALASIKDNLKQLSQ